MSEYYPYQNNPDPNQPGEPGGSGGSGQPGGPGGPGSQSFETVPLRTNSARIPEAIGRGVFSTGMVVITTQTEFVLDFVLRMGRPHQVAARVVMPHAVMPRYIEALHQAIENYKANIGPLPALPKPPEPERKPTIQEIYDELKLPDPVLSGAYANAVMIGHSAAEFSFDFVTNFFPQSAVSCRVFVAAAQAGRILESLHGSYQQFLNQRKPFAPPEGGPA